MRQRTKRSRSGRSRQSFGSQRARLELLALERRELLSVFPGFGTLSQVSGATPWPNTSDTVGQSGTYYLNSEVEPYLAVDPNNPLHLVAVWQQDRWSNGGSRGIMSAASFDGGQSWTATPLPGSTVNTGGSTLRASDPWVTIGPDGTVYADYLTLNDPNLENPRTLSANVSTNGGLTWSDAAAIITNSDNGFFNDKNSITADPYHPGAAYAVWDRLNFYNNTGPAMFSRTTDGGQTWSTPQAIYDPTYGQTLANQIVVLPGDVLVNVTNWIDYATNVETIQVQRSTDQGTTWSAPITVNTIQGVGVTDPDNGTGVRSGDDIPMIAVDRTSGNLYVVWQDGRFSGGTHDDIAFTMSTDGGQTWTVAQKVNQTPTGIPAGDQQTFTASVAVAANGTVAVSYYDFRNNTAMAGLDADYWIAFANPSQPGFTFGNEQRLTNSSFNMELAPYANGLFVGDYEALYAGGSSFNTFGALFGAAVSSSDPTSIFFRGAVPPNTLSMPPIPTSSAVEGQNFTATVPFSDSSPHPDANSYSAVISWGDGTTSTLTASNGGIVADGAGSFHLVLSHVYGDETTSPLILSAEVTDNAGGDARQGAYLTVGDAPLSAGALTPPAAVEGQGFSNVTVFHFTDANPYAVAGDFSADVSLGNGSRVTLTSTPSANGQIVAAGDGFDVRLTYTYDEEVSGGVFAVAVTDVGGSTVSASTNGFSVADAPLAGVLTPPAAVEGQAFSNVTVFHFSDADPGGIWSDYTAVVTLGDGNTVTLTGFGSANGQIVAAAGGGFDVRLTYTYAEELSGATFAVRVTDIGGATTSASTNSFSVADAPLTATPRTITATEGSAVTGVVVATFTDADPGGVASDYAATVNWGDGGASASVMIVADGNVAGQFDIVASKSSPYAHAGSYSITVMISDAGGATATANSTAQVADAALTAAGATFSATEGASWSGTVATFTDANTLDSIGSYSATIAWGDGNSSAGTIVAGGGAGQFVVQGTHTYAEAGAYAVHVTINDVGGSTAQATSTANVADAALSGSAVNFTTSRNRLFSGVVATFSDANSSAPVGDFTATIAWGDGASSSGTVAVRTGGGFQVSGSHTYTKKGTYTFTVTIVDRDGARLVVSGKATVNNGAAAQQLAQDAAFIDPSWLTAGDFADPFHRDRYGRIIG